MALYKVWVGKAIVMIMLLCKTFLVLSKMMRIYKETLKKGKLKYKEMKLLITEFIDYYNNKRIQEGLGFFASKWF